MKDKQRLKESINVRETQIEDVLATYPDLLKDILGISGDISLISRQKVMPSGNKIDLLFIAGKRLLLVELKIDKFQKAYLSQAKSYMRELNQLQKSGKLVAGDIVAYLLCSEVSNNDRIICEKEGVNLIKYSPHFVLDNFFFRLKRLANFIILKPTNHGLWNIYLLNRILYHLENAQTINELEKITGLSKSTIKSYLSIAYELLLVNNLEGQWSLTDIGKKLVWNKDPLAPVEFISEDQSRILQNTIIQNPFASGTIMGIYTIVESLFNLSKNTYPVSGNLLMEYFRTSSGRFYEWDTPKTAFDSMRMYSNYAIDLGLIGKIGNKYYLTPDGIRFILLLNLHKAIKVIDALGISKSEI